VQFSFSLPIIASNFRLVVLSSKDTIIITGVKVDNTISYRSTRVLCC
jgi:hypothetical protein